MVGEFDPQLRISGKEITVCGPLRWDPGDEGMTVQIDATVAQNGNEVKCNGNFTAPKKGEATFPFLTAWSMTVDVRDLAPGWAHGEGVAKNRGNVKSDWETPDPEAIPAEAPIQLVRVL